LLGPITDRDESDAVNLRIDGIDPARHFPAIPQQPARKRPEIPDREHRHFLK